MILLFRTALKTAQEEWDKDRLAVAYSERGRYEEEKWRNVSVEDPMYAMKIHPNLAPPIIEAAMNGHSDIVQLLLDHGANAEILTKRNWRVETESSQATGNVSLAVAARQFSMIIHIM